jgi:endonuclease III related protein
VLVQNTAWRNADLAIANLRASGLLDSKLLAQSAAEKVERLIRPAGFQSQKSQTLVGLSRHVTEVAASFEQFLAQPTPLVREALLSLRGIGPETADSILLYAGCHAIFVVDVYLRRFLLALGFDSLSKLKYEHLRLEMEMLVVAQGDAFRQTLADVPAHTPSHPPTRMSLVPRSPVADIYNELHAILVRHGVEKRRGG